MSSEQTGTSSSTLSEAEIPAGTDLNASVKQFDGNGHADPAPEATDSDATSTDSRPPSASRSESASDASTARKTKPRKLVKAQTKDGGLVQLVREQAEEIKQLREQLDTAEGEREDIQDQYDDLLDKVTHIKATLGERLKTDAAKLVKCEKDLSDAREQLATANEAQRAAEETTQSLREQISEREKAHEAAMENLKSQLSVGSAEHKHETRQLKQERDRLQLSVKSLNAELEKLSKEKMSLDMALEDERTQKSRFESKIAQVSEELATQTGYAEHYRNSSLKAEQELAQLTADTNTKITGLEQQVQALEREKTRLQDELSTRDDLVRQKDTELEETKKQLLQNQDLQSQIKEKNLQIGKLRHEAVILNEHLTNALATVRKGSQGQSIDKELISNLVLQFASIPRGDSKKYEVLQLISNTLSWDEAQQAQAGLTRSQSAGNGGGGGSGGLLGKFAEFLERESNKNRTT